MTEVHEINHTIERIFNIVSGIVFNANDGFRVLIIFFNFFFNRNGIATPPYKSTIGGNGVNSFFEMGRFTFGFYGH